MTDQPDEQARVARRWRLALGRYSDRALRPPGWSQADGRADAALDFLYGRLYQGRGIRQEGGRGADLSESAPHVVTWLEEIRGLFPEEVCQRLTKDAVNRFGILEVLADPFVLQRVTPDEQLLATLLGLRSALPGSVLGEVRAIVATVVAELTLRLRSELAPALAGRPSPTPTARPTGTLDPGATVVRNLHTWDPQRGRLLVERLWFVDRARVRLPWDVVLVVDQSASMASSVINSAVLAGILAGLPGVHVKIVVFDTAVVDLTDQLSDPVDVLFGMQLGGGTDINRAIAYSQTLITRPRDTVFVLISDLYEGGVAEQMLRRLRSMRDDGVQVVVLLALSDEGAPSYDHEHAAAIGELGIPAFACTPDAFPDLLAAAISGGDMGRFGNTGQPN